MSGTMLKCSAVRQKTVSNRRHFGPGFGIDEAGCKRQSNPQPSWAIYVDAAQHVLPSPAQLGKYNSWHLGSNFSSACAGQSKGRAQLRRLVADCLPVYVLLGCIHAVVAIASALATPAKRT